mmetsp:Transcript_26239/g.55682  ORF Transcript_26239/g.55682 Transcript_26239/m.55682 type:complete len:222 (-) Transcript_26239:996-1661(-)
MLGSSLRTDCMPSISISKRSAKFCTSFSCSALLPTRPLTVLWSSATDWPRLSTDPATSGSCTGLEAVAASCADFSTDWNRRSRAETRSLCLATSARACATSMVILVRCAETSSTCIWSDGKRSWTACKSTECNSCKRACKLSSSRRNSTLRPFTKSPSSLLPAARSSTSCCTFTKDPLRCCTAPANDSVCSGAEASLAMLVPFAASWAALASSSAADKRLS